MVNEDGEHVAPGGGDPNGKVPTGTSSSSGNDMAMSNAGGGD